MLTYFEVVFLWGWDCRLSVQHYILTHYSN